MYCIIDHVDSSKAIIFKGRILSVDKHRADMSRFTNFQKTELTRVNLCCRNIMHENIAVMLANKEL